MGKTYENSGILFKNNDKQAQNHADYKGSANIDGNEYFMDAWIRKGEKGNFMSFKFKAKTGKPAQTKFKEEDDDAFPF